MEDKFYSDFWFYEDDVEEDEVKVWRYGDIEEDDEYYVDDEEDDEEVEDESEYYELPSTTEICTVATTLSLIVGDTYALVFLKDNLEALYPDVVFPSPDYFEEQ